MHAHPLPLSAANATVDEFTISATPIRRAPRSGATRKPARCSTMSICATIRAGPHREYWYHGAGCHAWLVVTRNTRHPCDCRRGHREARSARSERGVRHPVSPRGGADRPRAAAALSRFDGRAIAASPATRSPRRCSPTASRLVGRSFKYHRPRGILTAGSEEPNALVELRNGARREPNTRATTVELYRGLEAQQPKPLAVARVSTLLAMNKLFSPFIVGRLLLQDLHVAGEVLGEALRAADPPRRGPRPRRRLPDPDHYEKAFAHLRRAGDRRRARRADSGACGRPRRRARHPVRRGFRARRPAAGRTRARSTAAGVGCGSRGRWPNSRRCPRCGMHAAHDGVRRLRSAAPMARSSASAIICRVPPQHQPRQRLLADRREARRARGRRASNGRSCLPATTARA